jgi:hypothetical protein
LSVLDRQRVLGRFLSDEAFEARVRSDPSEVARSEGVSLEFVERLARITPERVAAFRRSRAHKDAVRAGKRPTRLDW